PLKFGDKEETPTDSPGQLHFTDPGEQLFPLRACENVPLPRRRELKRTLCHRPSGLGRTHPVTAERAMRKLLPLCCWHSWLLLFYGDFQVCGAHSRSRAHPGFEVLASASHYWPLENVDGIHELQDTTGGTYGLTVLPSHDSAFVYANDPTYSNLSATVDIVEGKINKGIYLKEEKGVTLLYYGRYKTSCISNPAQCGPEGVTFSFFWKTQEQSRPSPSAYGGQVISNGFKVCSSGGKGLVELYMRENSMTWEASFSPPGKAAFGPSSPSWGAGGQALLRTGTSEPTWPAGAQRVGQGPAALSDYPCFFCGGVRGVGQEARRPWVLSGELNRALVL
ncbi:hypothetical protein MC885_015694, partial [Smutsia gigantea]